MYTPKLKRHSLILPCILILSLLIISISCATKPDIPSPEEAEKAVIEKERQALDRWSAGDPLGFAINMADEVTYFDDIAAHTRLDGIEEVKKHFESLEGKIPAHSYEMVDSKVQVYGDVAILTFRYHSTSSEGQSGPPWKATAVFHYTEGQWFSVHEHWSLVKEQ